MCSALKESTRPDCVVNVNDLNVIVLRCNTFLLVGEDDYYQQSCFKASELEHGGLKRMKALFQCRPFRKSLHKIISKAFAMKFLFFQ